MWVDLVSQYVAASQSPAVVANASMRVAAPVSGVPSTLFVTVTVKMTGAGAGPPPCSQMGVDVHLTWYLQSSSSLSWPYMVGPYGHESAPPPDGPPESALVAASSAAPPSSPEAAPASATVQLAWLVGWTIMPPSSSAQCVSAGPGVGCPGLEHVAADVIGDPDVPPPEEHAASGVNARIASGDPAMSLEKWR